MTESLMTEGLFTTDNEKTFQHEDSLPSLPLPNLHETLQKYLASVKPLVNDEDYLRTKRIVEQFENGVGRDLQKKLMLRSNHSRNWLETWWNDVAYLEGRYPASPLINMAGVGPYLYHYYTPKEGTQIERAAVITHFTLKAWQMIRRERLKPDKNSKGQVFSMNQFRRMYNTCKIPGVKKDYIQDYFKTESEGACPHNVVVACKGRIFSFDGVDENDEPLTVPELQSQLQIIRDECDHHPSDANLCCLTADKRTSWAQLRSRLISLDPHNWENLELIQQSIFMMCLEEDRPKNDEQVMQGGLYGDPINKWFDKSFTLQFYKNGLCSSNCDHAAADAMGLVVTTLYVDLCVKEIEGKWRGQSRIRPLKKPMELNFTVDDIILKGAENARQLYHSIASNIESTLQHFKGYGKKYLKDYKLHPDTHVQLALQYAYYRKYKKPAPTYETATTRLFYHGRTETVRSCTVEAIDWCKAMLDPSISNAMKYKLYLAAAEKHNKLMEEATRSKGCDRHLLGLSLVAKEENIPEPEIFTDASYTKSGGGGNFMLSTSCAGYTSVLGGVAPMAHDGYGVFYRIVDDRVVFFVAGWKSSNETNTQELMKLIHQTLSEMKELLDQNVSTVARL